MSVNPKYKSLRGMPDILPEKARLIHLVEEKSRSVFARFGFGEIRTPLLEETEVFTRSIGEQTDIVSKEMYSFTDRGGKNISLRPEGTASIIRAYIEQGLYNENDLVKLFYTGPMFRGERPQKGRLRQFNQIGAEIIGGKNPYIDAELILSLDFLLKELGVSGFTILINSLGCNTDRKKYEKVLKEYLSKKKNKLCKDCQTRSEKNVLRVLDCKRKECKAQLKDIPIILDSLCRDCLDYYKKVKNILQDSGVKFKEKKDLVRGLDYYTGTIFEVVHDKLGSQDAIAAGGRYDDLTRQMNGPDTGAIGYAIGVERFLLVLGDSKDGKTSRDVLVVTVTASEQDEAFKLANKLREEGISAEVDLVGRSFKGQMRKANRENKRFVIILGPDEVKSGKVQLKDMEQKEQKLLGVDEAVKLIKG